MNKLKIVLTLLLSVALSVACSNNQGERNTDSSKQTEEIDATSVEPIEEVDSIAYDEGKAFIVSFYHDNIAQEGEELKIVDVEAIGPYLTENAKLKLREAYDMECPSGDCLAVWLFYGGGVDDIVSQILVYPQEDKDCFEVSLRYARGETAHVVLQLVRQEGRLMINDISSYALDL